MVKITFTLFDRLDWKYVNGVVLGNTEDECYEALDKEYPKEYRNTPWESIVSDSLQILGVETKETVIIVD